MARKGTGIAVLVGAAIAVGAVIAFASGKKKPEDEADTEADEGAEPSPVLPTQAPPVTPLGTPPFVPPGLITVSTPATATTPPIAPPVVAPPVVLPDDDDEAESPTVQVPPVVIPAGGTTVQLPGGISIPVPTIPGVTAPAETPAAVPAPPVPAIELPSPVPPDTAALAAEMLADEATTNWKRKYPALATWQAARGLTADGSFGPGSAKRMALEIGTLPIIRFWPRGTLRETALEPYRNELIALANAAPEPRRAQLIMSANREQGQSFGVNPPVPPIKTLVQLKAVAA